MEEEESCSRRSNATSTTTGGITLRLLTVLAVAAVSVWANHEASKGFEIYVSNEIADTAAARRFHLLFVADDSINRMVLSSSRSAERLLYSENAQEGRKIVKRVHFTVRLSSSDHPQSLVVRDARTCIEQCHCYTIYVSGRILGKKEDTGIVRRVVGVAVQKAMAYVWLSDGNGRAPAALVEGLAEYVTRASVEGLNAEGMATGEGKGLEETNSNSSTGSRTIRECWLAEDSHKVEAFIGYCECLRGGFLARLNGKMAEGWRPEMVDEALGSSSRRLCFSFSSMLALPSQSMAESCRTWRTWFQ